MAVALKRMRDKIRLMIRDTDARKPTFIGPEIDNAIAGHYLTLQAGLPAPVIVTASAFTISAGETFSLPVTVTGYTGNDGGAEYRSEIRIQLVSNKQWLRHLTMDEMESRRHGEDSTLHRSIPDSFALYEEKDQTVQGICWPATRDAQVCNLHRTLSADDVRDFVGAGTDDMEDVEILFSRVAARALELVTAADLLERMPDEDIALRRINPRVAVQWRRDADALLYAEAERRHNAESTSRLQRWVS